MPELIAGAVAIGKIIAAPGIASILQAGVLVGSPAEGLVIGGPRPSAMRPPEPPADVAAFLHTDEHRRDLLLASRLGLRTSVPYGARAYVSMAAGVCLEPEITGGAALLVDPDVEPQPGDVVVIWAREDRSIAVRNRRGRQVLLDDDELLEPDEHVASLLATHHVARPGAWAYCKRLVRPLPPRATWADDTNYSLVVETTNPAMEYRGHLREVLAIDTALAVLDFSGDPQMAALWARAARERGGH